MNPILEFRILRQENSSSFSKVMSLRGGAKAETRCVDCLLYAINHSFISFFPVNFILSLCLMHWHLVIDELFFEDVLDNEFSNSLL